MQISECDSLLTLSSENDNARTCQDSGVRVPRGRRGTLNFRLDPTTGIQIKYMGVVQIDITLLFATVVVSLRHQVRLSR
jgi:hypothetical protein